MQDSPYRADYPTIYRKLRGIHREIGFGFVSCSCRACVRAKLRERVSDVSAQRWRQKLQHFLLRRSGLGGVSVVFAHRWKGFKLFVAD